MNILQNIIYVGYDNVSSLGLSIYIFAKTEIVKLKDKGIVGGGDPFYLKSWVNRYDSVRGKSPILNRYSLVPPHP